MTRNRIRWRLAGVLLARAFVPMAAQVQKPPADLNHDLQLGEQYLSLKLYTDAAAACKNALIANPANDRARQCLADAAARAQATGFSTFRDALKSQWISQFLAALLIVAGAWFGLHLLRWLWRKILSLWARLGGRVRWIMKRQKNDPSWMHQLCVGALDKVGKIQWAFTPLQDDGKLGANDAVLDAMRRMPNEVAQPIWTPGRLVLHNAGQSIEVWEDFGKAPAQKPLHEEVFSLLVNQGRAADNALADAFQNLQFNVGSVGFGAVAKFWRAILDWWRDGQPGFSGVAQETATADNMGKQVVIRLTCSGGPYGTVTVQAATKREDSVDAVALTASRAAYKLLSRMTPNAETVEQIDGHAAFRQGARILSSYVRAVADSQADQARTAELNKAVVNLEFARQVFCRDASHLVYYLETLRFEAIGYALLGHAAAALTRFEELEDKASVWEDPRSQSLATEAAFNQGILHMAANNNPEGMQLAATLFSFVESQLRGDPLAKAAVVRRAELLAGINRETWPQLNAANCEAIIGSLQGLVAELDQGAKDTTGDERRAFSVLATEARRYLAIAVIRKLGAFDEAVADRFETSPPAPLDPKANGLRVRQCCEWFEQSDAFGSATLNALVCRAHALLLLDKWRPAEYYARQALALDKTSQFASYLAAEACYQRNDHTAAQQCIAALAPNLITDPALCRLNRRLNPAPESASMAACA
jgi:hypothetical protein